MSSRSVAVLVVAAALVCAFLAFPARVSVPARAWLAEALSPLVRFEHGILGALADIRN